MSLTPKQQAVLAWAKSQLEFFETSNDVKSYTHYNDIEQTLESLTEEISNDDLNILHAAMTRFYTVLKNLQ